MGYLMKKELRGKIIGVGFQKTGTSSLRDALHSLGYSVGDNNYKLLFPLLHGNYRKVLKTLSKYDAVEDNPWPLIYKELDKRVPDCKFILALRDPESWYTSVSRHIGKLRSPMHEWIYGRGNGIPLENKQNAINIYRRHNQEVIEYFKNRPDDLLILDFTKGDSWGKLCRFLDKPIPGDLFPHANDYRFSNSKTSLGWKLKIQKKKIKYWLQIQYFIAARKI